jgi:drug/metabolite transporter (DMT)-like permease
MMSIIAMDQLILILISGIFLDFYLIPYFKALTLDDASKVVPLLQFSPIFVLVLSYIFLDEALTSRQLLGFALIIVSGFVLGAERIEKGIFTSGKSFWFMILASFLFSITGVLFKFVVITQDFWLTLAYESIGMGIGAFILLLRPAYRSSFRREIEKIKLDTSALLAVNQCFSVLAQLAISYAFFLAPAALVSAIGGVQSFFVLLFGFILSIWFPRIIREKTDKITIVTKVISIFFIFIGVYLVYI